LGDVFRPAPEIAPSTFCQNYRPVKAPHDKGTPEFYEWWEALPEVVGYENDIAIRANNLTFQTTCKETSQ